MKRVLMSLFASLFILASTFAGNINGKVEEVSGKVQASEDNISWTKVDETTVLKEQDIIQTGFHSSITFIFDDVKIKLGSLSRVVVKKAVLDKEQMKSEFDLKLGKANVELKKSRKSNHLEIDTKSSVIEVTGTKFDVSYEGNLNVYEGVVKVYDIDDYVKSRNNGLQPPAPKEVRGGERFHNGIVERQPNIKPTEYPAPSYNNPSPNPQFDNHSAPTPSRKDGPGNQNNNREPMPAALPPKSKDDRK